MAAPRIPTRALRICFLFGALLLLLSASVVHAKPRNVLWICADDHATFSIGAYGSRQARTPCIDRLASQGLRFDRAYCNSPVCTASRQSFLTGRYPRSIGVTLLQTALPESELTLAEMLSAEGYDTAALGKMHFNSNLRHGFECRLDLPDHRQWLAQQAVPPLPKGLPVLPIWRPFRDPAAIWLNSGCLPYGATDQYMASTWIAHEAARWLKQRSERPFFLFVSFYEPHSPFHFPIEFAGRHEAESFSIPAVLSQDAIQIPRCFRDLTERQKQGIHAAYHTSVEFLDKNMGLVLDALDCAGHADDTLVVYFGDHGYLLGHHGRFEKHTSYEEAIRAPLIMRLPSVVPTGATSALVEFVDLVPTVLDLCEVPIPDCVQGRSLLPLAFGATERHRDQVVVEYAPNEEACIRTDRWKLVYIAGLHERQDGYTTGEPPTGRQIRLYDTHSDPHELYDVAELADNANLVQQLLEQLAQHLRDTARLPDEVPDSGLFETLDYCVQPRDVASSLAPVK